MSQSKETYVTVERDLCHSQKKPTICYRQKSPAIEQKETCYMAKETYQYGKCQKRPTLEPSPDLLLYVCC